jgi:hypothetical protein
MGRNWLWLAHAVSCMATTNLGVRGSNPFGRANLFKDLVVLLRWIVALGFQWGSSDADFHGLDSILPTVTL